ncbi:capsule polysaccharide export protein [Fermentimonas caenicola]|uniref:Capsule polysaccharide export protein n=1 Tax=Fermentimonas caenicola TaxID=1562970 RepID=A0A098BYK0_9BACT|nr:capsule polysaccharide export protein [Fermentimonas caenicola]
MQRLRDQYMGQEAISTGALKSNNSLDGDVLRGEAGFEEAATATEGAVEPGERIYGQNLFSSQNLTFAPNMNMPTPANYVLGAGDQIIIDVWGDSELNVQYTIAPDGHITVPGIGRIQLSGMNVKQAESRIRTQFSTIYSDLDSSEPHTFLAISVGNVRTIKVNVMGEVRTPGTYTLSSFSSAFHAMYAAGGTTRIGSLRNIRIFRAGRQAAEIDLYEYLMKGNSMSDITLQDGDIVMVEPFGILAQATGEVRRPMWYEMKPDETLEDLIRYSGGFSGNAYSASLTLLRSGEEEMEAYTLSQPEYSTFQIKDGDRVEVNNILDEYANMVEITGSVYRPGRYAIGDKIITVRDLLEVALGTTGDAYLQRALLYRENDDLTRSMESFNVSDLMSGRINDITLKKNDLLHIPSVLSLDDRFTVYIGGEVRKPDSYPYADNMRLEDIILQAGGITEAASTARIDVYRRIKDPASTELDVQTSRVETFSLLEGELVSSNPDFRLEPFDQIIVRRSPAYEIQQMVTIEGEVLFEGDYAKISKDERLSSLVNRAGGLTQYAYIKGARLSRRLTADELEKVKESLRIKAQVDQLDTDSLLQQQLEAVDLSTQYVAIDLEKALKNPGGQEDIILREGDVLTIPEYNELVKISGGVLYPNLVTYRKHKKLGYYIDQAGGYSRLALKSKPFVVYMNGEVASGRWAKIEPGCEIIVPERPEREPMSLQGILSLGTSIASIALLISNLVR